MKRCCLHGPSRQYQAHFGILADFISFLDKEAIAIFREVLFFCNEMGLIGKEMFAVESMLKRLVSGMSPN
ncbi:MAG: hypothetical protein KQH63_13885 [Desulfobulbaceae bacterium]|nr:hypothetical protein [Desulfobulbaceae bacterium]